MCAHVCVCVCGEGGNLPIVSCIFCKVTLSALYSNGLASLVRVGGGGGGGD